VRSALIRAFVLAAALCGSDACTPPPEPVVVEGHMIRVENHTSTPWTDVEIWVNDHYRVTRRSIAPGERVQVPLDAFVAGFGQRFDVRRQTVKGVEVTGKKGNEPLKLVWGEGRRKI
jgi:hypothetical protein